MKPSLRLLWPLLLAVRPAGAADAVPAGSLMLKGQLDAAVTALRGPDGHWTRQLVSDVGGASFLALQVREPLAGGWQALAVLDAGLQTDTGRGRANNDPGTTDFGQPNFSFGRRAVVGLASTGTELLLGRDYHPVTWAGFALDPLGLRFWGNLAGATSIQSGRFNNGIFLSQGLGGGWQLRAAYGAGSEAAAGQPRGDGRSLSLGWRREAWTAELAWLREATGAGPAFALPSVSSHVSTHVVGLAWNPGAYRLAAGFSQVQGGGDSRDYRRQAAWVGGQVALPVPGLSLYGSATQTRSHPGRALTLATALEQRLSPRSAIYLSCARVGNDRWSNVALAAAIPQVGATGPAAVGGLWRGVTLQACSLGMRQAF